MIPIKDWWETQHRKQTNHLSNHPLYIARNFLDFQEFLKPGSTVLCIGVGTGGWMREMYVMGIHMHALDISLRSLANVKPLCVQTYIPDNMKRLPPNTMDLVVSFYVAQHMVNEDLEHQMKCVIPSLKRNGVLALQYMEHILPEHEPDYDQGLTGYPGRVLRSQEQMSDICSNAGGIIEKVVGNIPHRHLGLREVGIHVRRK